MLRATLLHSLVLFLTLAAAPAAEAAPSRGKPAARKVNKAKAKPAKKRAVFLERRVPAVRNNLPNVQALGALVVDLESGREVFSRKPDQPRAIASISKLAAALVVVDRGLDLDARTTMSRVDIDVARGGAPSRLPEGMTLSNRDLLHAAMLGSDNRAVSALGRAVGLNATQLAEAMTRKAAKLGLKQTRFRDPTGLSPQNVSTPRESIAMLRAAMAHPVLAPILRRMEYDAHPVSRAPIRYVNTHRPAHRANTDVMGGKTGYNNEARYCLVLAAKIDGRSYGMAFLGTEGKMTRFGDSARVADWVVANRIKLGGHTGPALAKNTEPASPALARNTESVPGTLEPGAPANDNGQGAPAAAAAGPDGGVASALAVPPAIVVRP